MAPAMATEAATNFIILLLFRRKIEHLCDLIELMSSPTCLVAFISEYTHFFQTKWNFQVSNSTKVRHIL